MLNTNSNVNAVKLVRYLSSLNTEELEFVQRTVNRAQHKNISPEQAAHYSSLQVGQKVSALGPDDKVHNVIVKRVNQKYVKVHDPVMDVTWDILPDQLEAPLETSKKAEPVKKATGRTKKTVQ